jgi:hypothetical protein
MSYLTYFNQNTGLSADFIPLDEQGDKISSGFLESLSQKIIYQSRGGGR